MCSSDLWYYYWDRSGDGTSANSGSLNGGVDYTTHDVLDGIFNQDISGTVGGAGNTTDTYRYATLNGVHLALPTANGGMAYPSGINNYQPGTAYTDAGATSNGTTGTYDELLAIWDAYNGTGTGTNINGTPSGWQALDYWSATPSASGHAFVGLNNGFVYDYDDTVNVYVALQVLETVAPAFTSAASANFAENGTGTAYDATADGDVGVSYSLSGTDSALFNINTGTGAVTFIAPPNYEAPADAGGNNLYDFTVTATDGSGNTTDQAVALTVTNVGEAGDTVIDLGADGKLIAPVQVEGNWYYYWDRSGDGTSANTGGLNGGLDYTTHDVLDGIFTEDINGSTGGGGNTTDTYRYATLNGVHLALPTANGGTAYPNGINANQPGTAYTDAGATSNGTTSSYNELLAIWDAYNGTGTGTNINGTPSGWQAYGYWSATPSASGHAFVYLYYGYVYDNLDNLNSYVALQVL